MKNGSVTDGSGLSRAMSRIVVSLAPSTPKRTDTWYVSDLSTAVGVVVLVFGFVVVVGADGVVDGVDAPGVPVDGEEDEGEGDTEGADEEPPVSVAGAVAGRAYRYGSMGSTEIGPASDGWERLIAVCTCTGAGWFHVV